MSRRKSTFSNSDIAFFAILALLVTPVLFVKYLIQNMPWLLKILVVGVIAIIVVKVVTDYNYKEHLKALINNQAATTPQALLNTPAVFGEIRQPKTKMLVIPKVSSETRRYIPICYVDPKIIINGSALIVPNANLFHLGVLISNVHMSWMRAVCGRLKSDYQYSANVVYNNFPWPTPTEEQKAKIEQTAQGILDARALYPDCSLADLYDPLTMPPELRKAHQLNDKAVMQAYGLDVKSTSEADCVAFLMKKYQELTEK